MKRSITDIFVYPLKSLGSVAMNESLVEKRGLQNDRRFMVVDDDGEFLTQRQIPGLAKVKVDVGADLVTLSFHGKDDMEIRLTEIETLFVAKQNVGIWDSRVDAIVAGDDINDWLSDVMNRRLRLVYMPAASKRLTNPRFNTGQEIVSFADGYPLLVTNIASLTELNSRLDEPVPMNRFRPNVVFQGIDSFEEDGWQRIRIGSVTFRVTKPCARCTVTTVDQTSGEKQDSEPLKTLSAFRKASQAFPNTYSEYGLNENDVLFGVNLVPESFGTIKLGDELNVVN